MPRFSSKSPDPKIIRKLQRRVRRTVQAEVIDVLEKSETPIAPDARTKVKRVRALFAGRKFSDSAALVRRDRAR